MVTVASYCLLTLGHSLTHGSVGDVYPNTAGYGSQAAAIPLI